MQLEKDKIEQVTEAAASRWGSWVKYVIGAIIGALAASGIISVSGCTISVDPEVVRYIIPNPIDNSGK